MQRSAMASAILGFSVLSSSVLAQEKSVRPGVNDSFRDPKVSEFQEKFEIESRQVFEAEILSCGFKKVCEHSDLLKENYFIEFERVEP